MTAPDEPDTRPRCPNEDCHATYPVIEDTAGYERERTGMAHYCPPCNSFFRPIEGEQP